MVEQLTLNQWVQGSSPWRCTKIDFVFFYFVATDSEFATCRSDTTSNARYRKRYAVGPGSKSSAKILRGAVVNDSPVDCQSRGRPSAQFARERVPGGAPKILRFFYFYLVTSVTRTSLPMEAGSPVRSQVAFFRLRKLGSDCSCSADFASSKRLLIVFPCSPRRCTKDFTVFLFIQF